MTSEQNKLSDAPESGLTLDPGYTNSFDTAIQCLNEEAKECDRINRVGRKSMLQSIAFELTNLKKRREVANIELLEWHDGEPPKPWRHEWFIALTIHGDRVVLRSLPEEWTYDYKTADDTYMLAKNIKKWMQFPDSMFKPAPALHSKALPA